MGPGPPSAHEPQRHSSSQVKYPSSTDINIHHSHLAQIRLCHGFAIRGKCEASVAYISDFHLPSNRPKTSLSSQSAHCDRYLRLARPRHPRINGPSCGTEHPPPPPPLPSLVPSQPWGRPRILRLLLERYHPETGNSLPLALAMLAPALTGPLPMYCQRPRDASHLAINRGAGNEAMHSKLILLFHPCHRSNLVETHIEDKERRGRMN